MFIARVAVRVISFAGAALLMLHLVACSWYFVAAMYAADLRGTWVDGSGERAGWPGPPVLGINIGLHQRDNYVH